MRYGLLFLLLFLFGCRPEFVKTWTVQYQVRRISIEPMEFSLTYRDNASVDHFKGPITDNYWTSDEYLDVPSGQRMIIEINVIKGDGKLELNVLRNGAVHATDELNTPLTELKLDTTI